MFKAQIKLTVLEHLNSEDRTGYELMKDIGEKFGKKPSPGYIYPLLKDLKNKSFIKESKEENKISYSITKDGKKALNELIQNRKEAMERMVRSIELLGDRDEVSKFNKFVQNMERSHVVHSGECEIFENLKNEIMNTVTKGFENKKYKFNRIMKKTIKDLKNLNKK